MTADKYKPRLEFYDPGSPLALTTTYLTLYDISGEGILDMLKAAFTNLSNVVIRLTIDGTIYYELDLADLKNKVKLTKDEQDTFLNTAKNSFSDSYPVPLYFESSLKLEVKKISGNKKIKGAIIRYRIREE